MEWLQTVWDVVVGVIMSFRVTDALDIALVSFIIYSGIKLVRETRAEQLVKGILIMVIVWILSYYLNLHMIGSLLNYFFQFSVFALLVVFQPELRRALEQIGRSRLRKGKNWLFSSAGKDEEDVLKQIRKAIHVVAEVAVLFQKQKTGALIVFEQQTKLGDIIDTGTIIDAEPSVQMIGNIFFNKAPLHDGAMIIRDGKIHAAGCILPLTKDANISVELGTRHRAAIGISENSDAVVVVVSEETGQISLAVKGVLTRNFTREALASDLVSLLLPASDEGEKRVGRIPLFRRAKKNDEEK